MDTPARWFGGKYRLLADLLPLFPPHHAYNEPFFGGGSVLFAKPPAEVETVSDLDREVTNFFSVLRDPAKMDALFRLSVLTPYARETFEEARDADPPQDDVERAYRFFVANRMSYMGAGRQWSFSQTLSRQHIAASVAVWLKGVDCLPEVTARLLTVQVENKDFRVTIPRYDTPETLHYCDPPYVTDTRVRGGYNHEMTDDDHRELVELLLSVKGMVLLSGYRTPIYEPLERAGWERREYETFTFCAGRAKPKSRRLECVWVSPKTLAALARPAPPAAPRPARPKPLALWASDGDESEIEDEREVA